MANLSRDSRIGSSFLPGASIFLPPCLLSKSATAVSLGCQRPDQLENTLADILGLHHYGRACHSGTDVLHHEEGVNLLLANIELSGLVVTLVNTASRKTVLREYLSSVREQYNVILLDCCPSLEMLTTNALAVVDEFLILYVGPLPLHQGPVLLQGPPLPGAGRRCYMGGQ